LTILHWGYDDKADYSGTARFVRAGLDTAVCPGTSGWKRIINAMGLAERNISTFAAAARGNGATGLLTTDWGDLGHFNQLACSWHGMALGAACGWDADHPTGLDFDTRFAQMLWCSPDPAPARLLRDLSSACGDGETWRLLHCAENEALEDPALPAVEKVGFIREAAGGARAWFEREPSSSSSVAQDFRELAVAARFAELFADRVTLLRCAGGLDEDKYKEALRETFRLYGELWITRNKPAGLGDIAAALGV
jgi:hypothetical protein